MAALRSTLYHIDICTVQSLQGRAMTDEENDIERLKIRQIIADIDQKRADTERKRQEYRFAPWVLMATGAGAGAAVFAAGAGFLKLLQG